MRNSELLQCPICYFEYDRANFIPKLLPDCGHTLCSKCLDRILLTQQPKCPLDRKSINKNLHFTTNLIVNQLLDENIPPEHGICSLHSEPNSLICITDEMKLCPSCLNGNDIHNNHQIKALSEIQHQAKKKMDALKTSVIKLDKGQKEVIELLEEKKVEAFGLKKRKFDAIRHYLDIKEHEVSSELGLLFCQKKTKTEEEFKKDQTFKQQVRVHLKTLKENKLDKAFFDALYESEVKDGVIEKQKEKQELDNLTKALEDELSLAEKNLSKSLVTVLDEFGPNLHQIRIQKIETPSKKIDVELVELAHIDSLLKIRRSGEILNIYYQDIRTEDYIQNDILSLIQLGGIKQVNLKLKNKKFSEETMYALGYMWKLLKIVPILSVDMLSDLQFEENTPQNLSNFFKHSFWISNNIEHFTLATLQYDDSNNIIWDKPRTSLVFNTLTKMKNLKSLNFSFANTKAKDETFFDFGNQVIPTLNNLEALNLDLSETDITDLGLKGIFTNCKGALKKVKSFSLNLSWTGISVKGLEILNNDILPNFDCVESFSLALRGIENLDENVFTNFWMGVRQFLKNTISFSLCLQNGELSDPMINGLGQYVLSAMTLLKRLELILNANYSLTLEDILKYSKFDHLEYLKFHSEETSISDYALESLLRDLLPKLPKLEALDMSIGSTQIGDRGSLELWKNLGLTVQNLKTFKFRFEDTEITDKGFEYFSQNLLPKMSSLNTLEIGFNRNIGAKSFEQFFLSLKEIVPHLEAINIQFPNHLVTDEVAGIFIDNVLPYMTSLSKLALDLTSASTTWATIEKICPELKRLTNLEYINICYRFTGNNEDLERLKANYSKFEIDVKSIRCQ